MVHNFEHIDDTPENDPAQVSERVKSYEQRIVELFEAIKPDIEAIFTERTHSLSPRDIQKRLNELFGSVLKKGKTIVNEEVEDAYNHGVGFSVLKLRSYGIQSPAGLSLVDKRTIDLLRARSLSDLQGISSETSKIIMRKITGGLLDGTPQGEIIRDIVGSVDNVGIVRAATMARTETMKAVNGAVRGRYEQAGAPKLQRLEAEDEKTCTDWPFDIGGRRYSGCAEIDGEIFDYDEAAEVDAQTHPNCRGTWKPYIEVPKDEEFEDAT
jgi:SPP1 gp7 family putative phage head morphogenesis protein